jgi:hypothetical protein
MRLLQLVVCHRQHLLRLQEHDLHPIHYGGALCS